MANSLSFNSIDLSAYGLTVIGRNRPLSLSTEMAQLQDYAYGFKSLQPPSEIVIDIIVQAADAATLLSYMDSIRSTLNQKTTCPLAIDNISGRYWLARFVSLSQVRALSDTWLGQIVFAVHDVVAYDNTATESGPYEIDTDPDGFTESVGGTGKTVAVFTLNSNTLIGNTGIYVYSYVTGENLYWYGYIYADSVLEIDVSRMYVALSDEASMFTVTGQFPELQPGNNQIRVSGFYGYVYLSYSKRYI